MSMRHLSNFVLVPLLLALGCGGPAEKNEADDDGKADDPPATADADPATGKGTPVDDGSPKLAVVKGDFGKLADGTAIEQYTLTNTRGTKVGVITYGAIGTGVHLPDRDGKVANVTLHHDDMAEWEANPSYFGAVVGRYGNRIAEGKFTLDDTEYQVAKNEDRGTGEPFQLLHGGERGFDKRVWTAEEIKGADTVGVKLTYVSADGEEGFPGEVTASVEYTLNEKNELRLEYTGTTTKPTVINLTNHCYWNLAGAGSGNVLDQVLELNCDQYVPVDPNTLIPTGELKDVEGTPFDFTEPKPIGAGVENLGEGFDHCFVVNGEPGTLRHVATATDPEWGRTMTVESTEPGVQFYCGNHLKGAEDTANNGYVQHAGFCLETNHFPNSPNEPEFPSTVLRPGETYTQTTVHRFGVVKE
jgi:aldose 1-epimerase